MHMFASKKVSPKYSLNDCKITFWSLCLQHVSLEKRSGYAILLHTGPSQITSNI